MLTQDQLNRIYTASQAAYRVPFIDDIEDYAWESIWAYSQGLDTPSRARTKRLFDVVDVANGIGWSAKTLVWDNTKTTCEFVVQRADVIKKASILGFSGLTLNSPPQAIGDAVLTHWRLKISEDMVHQGVRDPRVALLIKSKDRRSLVPFEEKIPLEEPDEIDWRWSSSVQNGLQGSAAGALRYRWYPNQKQLFETFKLQSNRTAISLSTDPIEVAEIIQRLGDELPQTKNSST